MTPPIPSFQALGRFAALFALIAAGSGCALRGSAKPPVPAARALPSTGPALTERPAQPLPETRIGSVRMIGRDGKFVLVETLDGGILTLQDGQDLHCRSGAEPGANRTADLRLSRERRLQFASADVVSGQPCVGDAVFVGGPGGRVGPSLLPAEIENLPGGRR